MSLLTAFIRSLISKNTKHKSNDNLIQLRTIMFTVHSQHTASKNLQETILKNRHTIVCYAQWRLLNPFKKERKNIIIVNINHYYQTRRQSIESK